MTRTLRTLLVSALVTTAPLATARAQAPSQAQVQAAMTDPQIRSRILAQVRASGMTPEQIRAQLKAMGYDDTVIGQLMNAAGGDTTLTLSSDVFAAVRSLGIMDSTMVDSLRGPVVERRRLRNRADSLLLDSLRVAIGNDTLRDAIVRLLESPAARRVGADSGFVLFGRELFLKTTKQFDPAVSGPLPPSYRIGYGDQFTLVFTGDFERTEDLTVTRDGWVVVRDAGQIAAANLTFDQFRASLAQRLGRVYSGIGRGTTRFSLLPKRVGTNQVYVLGDVLSPNAYPISRLGTVLTALYAAGGPTDRGNSRAIEVRRQDQVVATMDLYDYLMNGSSAGDIRLENGDVVFVRPQGPRVRVAGAVVRPATYELKANESLADVIRMAGGFRPEADRRRVQIERIVPASQRGPGGNDKEVIDITSPQLAAGNGPTTQKMEPGDVVRVFSVEAVVANKVEVEGNVYRPGRIAYFEGMRLSQAVERAGGIKPDTYLGAVQISRLQRDSSRTLTRVAFRADGSPENDIELLPNDIVHTFSITEFRTDRFVTVGGAVRKPRQIPFQEGMTLRDAILASGGLDESALLTTAEIARLPESHGNGVTAVTTRVPLDSTYLFERTPDGRYLGPPGVPVTTGTAPEVQLRPYDVISILRQPGFEYQRTVSVVGKVRYAATYSLKNKTERLTDILERAGGLTPDADSGAIIFIRKQGSKGRIGVDLPRVLRNHNDVDNLILVDGDSIFIPAYSAIVTVRGEVNALKAESAPMAAVAYLQGADIDYYIRSAGGGTSKADEGRAYVLQPNGKVETKHRVGLFFTSTPKPQAGAIVEVPSKDATDRHDWMLVAQSTASVLAAVITAVALLRR
jgi:protein involved in polysaccharide export with SLBB domain